MRTASLGSLLCLAVVAMASPAARADLIGYYTFDNFIDPRNDDSGMGNTLGFGNGGGNPHYVSGGGFNGNSAYSFDLDHFVAPINISPGTLPQVTIGAWVQTDTLTGLHKIIGSDDGGGDRSMGLDSRGNNFVGGFGDRYSAFTGFDNTAAGGLMETPFATFSPTGTGANDWSFVAVVYDQTASTATIYADIDASTTADALVSFSKSPTALGSGFATTAIGGLRPDGEFESWDGKIDNVFFFNEALSASQLTAIRDGTSSLLPAVSTGPEITLIDPNTNDGSFESNTSVTALAPTTLPPVWTISETGAGGVLGVGHSPNFKSDGDSAIFSDDGTTSATSFNLLGGDYTAVSEGDIFEWAVDFTANGAGSEAAFALDFGNGPIELGSGLTDADSATMETIFGTYMATAADAAGGQLVAIASITDSGPNAYLDNVRLGVTPAAAAVPEPSTWIIWGLIGMLGIAIAWLKRRTYSHATASLVRAVPSNTGGRNVG